MLVLALFGHCLSNAAEAQHVHVLPPGSSGSALQALIDAAADGDTLLLRGHFGPTVIDGKGLTLVSEDSWWVSFESLTISNTTVDQTVNIAGLTTWMPTTSPITTVTPGIVIDHCAGSVRLMDMNCLSLSGYSNPILTVVDSQDVVLMNFEAFGPKVAPNPMIPPAAQIASEGIRVIRSRLALYNSLATGGSFVTGSALDACGMPYLIPGGLPGPGITLDAQSTIFGNRTGFAGGNASSTVPGRCDCVTGALIPGTDAFDGGTAIQNATGSTVLLTSCWVVGGNSAPGGAAVTCSGITGGAGQPGSIGPLSTNPYQTLEASPLTWMSGSRVVRAGQSITLQFQGLPGTPIQLGLSTETRFVPAYPAQGILLIGPSGRRAALQAMPAVPGSVLSVQFPASLTVPGAEAEQWHFQAYMQTASGFQVGPVRDTTILAPAF